MDPKEEKQLRRIIRKELENRERLRGDPVLPADGADVSDERRRIIEEEISKFYLDKGSYRPFTNEQGDVEWLTEGEFAERERQIPVDMEELEEGQRRVRMRIVLMSVLFFVVVVLLTIAMRDRYGNVQVISNVPGATIVLDGSPTEFLTDFKLQKLSPGAHLISIYKTGYVSDGPATMRVNLKAGKNEVVALKLQPQPPSEPRGR